MRCARSAHASHVHADKTIRVSCSGHARRPVVSRLLIPVVFATIGPSGRGGQQVRAGGTESAGSSATPPPKPPRPLRAGWPDATAPRFPPKYNMKKVTDEMENYAALGDVKIVATSTDGPKFRRSRWHEDDLAFSRVSQPRGSIGSAQKAASTTPYPRHSVLAWSDVSVDAEENCGPPGHHSGRGGQQVQAGGTESAGSSATPPPKPPRPLRAGWPDATAPRFPPKYNMKKVTDEMENYAALGDVKIVATSTDGPKFRRSRWHEDDLAFSRVSQPRGSIGSAQKAASTTPYPRHSVLAWSDVSVDAEENCGPPGHHSGRGGQQVQAGGTESAGSSATPPPKPPRPLRAGWPDATAPRFPPKYNMKKVTDEMENYAALGDVKIVATSTDGPKFRRSRWHEDDLAFSRVSQPRGSIGSAQKAASTTPYPRHSVLAWSDVSVDAEENCGPQGHQPKPVQPRKAVAGGTPTPRYHLLVSDIEGDTTGHDAGACGTGSSSAASTGKTAGETTRRPAISDSRASCPVAPCNRVGWLHSELTEGDPCGWCGKPCSGSFLMGFDTVHCSHACVRATEQSVLDGTDVDPWSAFYRELLA